MWWVDVLRRLITLPDLYLMYLICFDLYIKKKNEEKKNNELNISLYRTGLRCGSGSAINGLHLLMMLLPQHFHALLISSLLI